MDLLIRRAPLLVCASLFVLAGCGTGSGAPHPAAGPTTPTTAPTATALPRLRALLPAERVVLARSGTTPAPALARWRTSDAFVVYGVCSGGGKITFSDRRSHAFKLAVPCDGVVSRSTVYSRAGRPVVVGVAGRGQEYRFQVSRLDEH